MKYLVTGGCGFIGSHIAQSLIDKNHEVVILDNLSTGKLENAPYNAQIIIGDVTKPEDVERAFDGIDGCFHLAAIASVAKSVTDWTGTHAVNSSATVNIFNSASKRKVPVVYTSSAAVYGDNPCMPLAEEDTPRPLTAYGADKLSCEYNGRIAWMVHGVPNVGIRPFNVYGPRQDPSSPYSGVISIFTNRITNNLPLTIFGDGEQVRDFIYVSDVVKIFTNAMDSLKEGYDIINACTGRATSINTLISTIESLCGIKAEKYYAEPRRGDIKTSMGNPLKLNQKYGFFANTTLKEGLAMLMGTTIVPLQQRHVFITQGNDTELLNNNPANFGQPVLKTA